MPEIRRDPVTGHRVIIAPDRALRPDPSDGGPGPCEFCPGREAATPAEILRLLAPGGGWRARVVPNKYPALDAASGGAHEVVIESARHVSTLAALTEVETADALAIWRDRLRAHAGRFAYGTVFRNEGAAAGASIQHAHSQVLAMPVVPPEAAARAASFATSCPVCEDRSCERGVAGSAGFVARVPLAPRFADEIRISPRRHAARFEELPDADLADLAGFLRATAARLGGPPFNLVVHTAPFHMPGGFHWHLELLPRTSRPGGCEWGTGMFINTAEPGASAERLRGARP